MKATAFNNSCLRSLQFEVRLCGWRRWLALVAVAWLACSGCESPSSQIARAKKLVGAKKTPLPTEDQEALDLRSADVESERFLPVLERLQRRQQTISRILERHRVVPR